MLLCQGLCYTYLFGHANELNANSLQARFFFFLLKGHCHFYISLCLSSSRGYYYCVSFCVFFFLIIFLRSLLFYFIFILLFHLIPVYFRPQNRLQAALVLSALSSKHKPSPIPSPPPLIFVFFFFFL